MAREETAKIRKGLAQAILCVVCALSLVLLIPAPDANADIRRTDIVAGSSVEEQDLSAAQCPGIDAEFAVLADADGKLYFQRNADTPTQIASITKVMTAIVAIENANLDLLVTVTADAASIGESSAGLAEGDSMNLETALKALLVPSGNDAAVAIAEAVGTQLMESDSSLGTTPMEAFVAMMNRKAADLGLADTVYENPHGLDDEDFAGNLHSTAADQAKVAAYAMTIPTIRSIVGGGSTAIVVDRGGTEETIELETTDQLLEMYSFTIGIKTGETLAAGPSFMGAANDGALELYAIVLKSTSQGQRFLDAQTLFDWGYSHFTDYTLANSSKQATMNLNGEERTVPVLAEVALLDWIDKTVDATLSDPDAKVRIFDLEGNVSQDITFNEVSGAVHAGDIVGHIDFKQHGNVIASYDLIACEDVESPGFFEGISIWWQRLLGGFSGAAEHAESRACGEMPLVNDKQMIGS